jgi:hypothetical protein
MAERRDFSDLVEILQQRRRGGSLRDSRHAQSSRGAPGASTLD